MSVPVRSMALAMALLFACAALGAEANRVRIEPSGRVTLVTGDQASEVAAGAFLRWGAPAEPPRRWRVELADGSTLVNAPPWRRSAEIAFDGESFRLQPQATAQLTAPRAAVRRLEFEAARDPLLAASSRDAATDANSDTVWTAAGDRLVGRLTGVGGKLARFKIAGTATELPLTDVAAIELAGSAPGSGALLAIGLGDGSLLRVRQAKLDDEQLVARLACGVAVRADAADVRFVQTLTGKFRYLSDLEPVDYQQTPYLGLAWPFATDRSLEGGPLRAAGRRYVKGVACHSATRLVYKLDGRAERFQAEAAIDDGPSSPGEPRGSVQFAVLAIRDGRFAPLFKSDIIRGGDEPVAIDVDISGAQGLALVVDYGDYGDEADRALWLDARLTP